MPPSCSLGCAVSASPSPPTFRQSEGQTAARGTPPALQCVRRISPSVQTPVMTPSGSSRCKGGSSCRGDQRGGRRVAWCKVAGAATRTCCAHLYPSEPTHPHPERVDPRVTTGALSRRTAGLLELLTPRVRTSLLSRRPPASPGSIPRCPLLAGMSAETAGT